MLDALAGPPFKPPLRPKATAFGFFFIGFGMCQAYVTAHAKTSVILLRIRERSRIILDIAKALAAVTAKALLKIKRDCSH